MTSSFFSFLLQLYYRINDRVIHVLSHTSSDRSQFSGVRFVRLQLIGDTPDFPSQFFDGISIKSDLKFTPVYNFSLILDGSQYVNQRFGSDLESKGRERWYRLVKRF